MTKSSKIFLTIFIAVLLAISFYGFSLMKDRASTSEKTPAIKQQKEGSATTLPEQNQTKTPSENDLNQDSANDETSIDQTNDETDLAEQENAPAEGNNFLDISKKDCDNNCKNFNNKNDLKYCQQTCGISEPKKGVTTENGCEKLTGLEKDYCFKDLAITKKDIQICAKIVDTNIFKTCRNRIAQDSIELIQ